jgi:hypothetical protein
MKDWGLRNVKDVCLADELLLDLLERMRIKYPNDLEYGREVRGLMERLSAGVEEGKVKMN